MGLDINQLYSIKCDECEKRHCVKFGTFPDDADPAVDYAIVFDPDNEYHLIFALRFASEDNSFMCVLDCVLDNEAYFTYLDRFPFQKIEWLADQTVISREEVLSTGLDKSAFTIVKALLSTDPSVIPVFKKWSSTV